jgi:hypothetical protein
VVQKKVTSYTPLVLASTLVTKPFFHKPPKPLETKRKENQTFFLKTIVDMERSKDPLNLNHDFRDPERFGMNTRHKIQHAYVHRNAFPIYFNIQCNLKPYTTTMHEHEKDILKLHNSNTFMVNVLTFYYEWEQEEIT